MKIEVWSDFQCPYCMLGEHRLSRALEQLGIRDADIKTRSFLLNPVPNKPNGLPMAELVKLDYGGEIPQILVGFQNLSRIALKEGLVIDQENAVYGYMMDAHRLLQFANTRGLGNRFMELGHQAVFQQHLLLSDLEVLLGLAEQAGLDRGEAREVLAGNRFRKEVLADVAQAEQIPIDYVPYYIINGTRHFSGDLSMEDYLRELRAAQENQAVI